MKTTRAIAALSLLGLICGCDKSASQSAPAAPAEAIAAAPAAPVEEIAGEPGSIKVTVAFAGQAPEMQELDRTADAFCQKIAKIDPSVQVKEGKLQNVVVRIAGKVRGDFTIPAEAVKIDQTECMYIPRVSSAVEGQSIQISNSDGTLHNVHAYKGSDEENWFNAAQPPMSPVMERSLEDMNMAHFKCDVHPWMNAWVAVSPHPFIGVSDAAGSVVLANVPSKAKPYKLEAWHESFGKRSADVVVEPGKTAEVTITFSAEQAAN